MRRWLSGVLFHRVADRRDVFVQTSRAIGCRPLWRRPTEFEESRLTWCRDKDALLSSNPGPVLIAASATFYSQKRHREVQVRKYSSFQSHEDFWECIHEHHKMGVSHNLHEVLQADTPRSLYFDIDGQVTFEPWHEEIMSVLKDYVRWVFCGDRMSWSPSEPEPVVLKSSDPTKYSCHVIFPQIQFRNHAEQTSYMKVLMDALPAVQAELNSGENLQILKEVVDRVPYMSFQLLRGPYACKVQDRIYLKDTQFRPQELYKHDPMTCFAGRAVREYALPLPQVEQLLDWNEEVRHFHQLQKSRAGIFGTEGLADHTLLYDSSFQMDGGGILDLAQFPVDVYEAALPWLHRERASQWWSWFRICGMTCFMLEHHGWCEANRARIWRAHHAWSSSYAYYSHAENEQMVHMAIGKRMPGLQLLICLVRFDNPCVRVRSSLQEPFMDYSTFIGSGLDATLPPQTSHENEHHSRFIPTSPPRVAVPA